MLCQSESRRRELIYINAGHPQPIIRASLPTPLVLDSTGPLLTSALSDLPWEQVTVEFGPGDSILFYTDGVTEASGASGMFGTERLISMMMGGDRRGAVLLDDILREVASFTGPQTIRMTSRC